MAGVNLFTEPTTAIQYPPTWKQESINRLDALSLTQEQVDEIEAGLARFRRIRDETAIERYQTRLPELRRVVSELRNRLSPLVARRARMLKVSKRERMEDWKTKMEKLDDSILETGQLYQAAAAELASIERDYPLRAARLGQKL